MFAFLKTKKWNAEQAQNELLIMLANAALNDDHKVEIEILAFTDRQGWPKSEAKNRIVHAVSMARVSFPPESYQKIKAVGLRIHNTIAIAG